MTMTAKKIVLVFLGLFVWMLLTPNVQAHSPKSVDLEYDFTAQTLNVKIDHWAMSVSVHFIQTVVIKKNGKKVETFTYENQPDGEQFTYTYKVPAGDGDVLEVTATCSVHGTRTVNLTVKKPKEKQ